MIFIKKIFKHKLIAIIILALIIGGGYFGYKRFFGSKSATQYVMGTVEKGTLIVSVSGSGQVSVLDQVDIKPKVSGEVISANLKNGKEVKAGDVLVQIDSSDAQKTIRDAETNLETAKLSLEKLKQPADDLTILQSENSLQSARDNLAKLKLSQQTDYQTAQESKQKAQDDLAKAYEDGFNNVANAFLELPDIMAGLHDILFAYSFGVSQYNIDYYADAAKGYDEKMPQYRNDVYNKYQIARDSYDQNFQDYKTASRFSDTSVIEALIGETYETTKNIAETIKSANNLIQDYQDRLREHNLKPQTLSSTHLSSLGTYTGITNSHLLNLLSIKSTIQTDKETIANAERDLKEMDQNNPLNLAAAEALVKEKEASLAELKAGPDPLDIRSQELAIKQKENALLDAKEKLADYSVRVPFDGILANVANVKKGDSVSTGTAVATLITKQKLAEISLNEVDVAKVKVGQKATLTFDAVEGLSISGEVVEVDILGTASQGVVNYKVKIGFDTQDERIKPGMSLSAAIITEVKQDVLLAPNSAVKSQGDIRYVEMVADNNMTRRQTVEVGLSNDTMSEITSGLKEGEKIVVRTSSAGTSNTSSRQQGPGVGGGVGGEIFRMLR